MRAETKHFITDFMLKADNDSNSDQVDQDGQTDTDNGYFNDRPGNGFAANFVF